MKIAIGCDHGGLAIKNAAESYIKSAGHDVINLGTDKSQSTDYPQYAIKASQLVISREADLAVLVCTTGIGMSITANRFSGIRAALCNSEEDASMTKAHNNANVLVLPGKLTREKACAIVRSFLETPFSGEERHMRRVCQLERAERVAETSHLAMADPEINATVLGQIDQENSTINLIASENTVTRAVREASGSVLTNKYAEGYPGKRWYSGCTPVDTAETLAIKRAVNLFGAEHANVQPHCGSAANMGVYFSVLEPGDRILSMSLDQGGHLTHGSPVNFSGRLFEIIPYCVSKETEVLDYDELMDMAVENKPKLIVAGASAYPRILDFSKFREIADACGAMLMVDMAHIAGLVAGGVHPSPVPFADFVTTTTHKTLRGPRGGLILCKDKYAKAVDKTIFPGLQGGPLENIIAAKAVCFKEASEPDFKDYAARIIANSKTLTATLIKRGLNIVSGGTDNHLSLVNVGASGLTGKAAAAALDAAGIICNKNTIPFDEKSPFVTSGIRIGTPSVTTRGMGEAEMKIIGNWIADILSDIENVSLQNRICGEVAELTAMFPVP
ncbi:MAG: ribose 5-phosphate isomerase B [Kiritimatiellia bacterium]